MNCESIMNAMIACCWICAVKFHTFKQCNELANHTFEYYFILDSERF